MLIILYGNSNAAMKRLAEKMIVDSTHYVLGPSEMDSCEEAVVDDVQEGKDVMIVVPAHAIAITYSMVEECKKLSIPVWQLKASER